MKQIVKYTQPMFRGDGPRWVIRSMMYGDDRKGTGLDADQYGRVHILSGPTAEEVANLLVKTYGGYVEKIS